MSRDATSCTSMRRSASSAGRKNAQFRMRLLCSPSRWMSFGHRPRTADQERNRVQVHVPPPEEADDEHHREVEVEDADQVERLRRAASRDTRSRLFQIVSVFRARNLTRGGTGFTLCDHSLQGSHVIRLLRYLLFALVPVRLRLRRAAGRRNHHRRHPEGADARALAVGPPRGRAVRRRPARGGGSSGSASSSTARCASATRWSRSASWTAASRPARTGSCSPRSTATP